MASPADLFNQYQSQWQSAFNQNQQRYQDTLGGYQARTAQIQAANQGYGQDQIAAAQQNYQQQNEATKGGLVSRGLGNTTIQDSLLAGNAQGYANTLRNINSDIATRGTNLLQQDTGDALRYQGSYQTPAQDYGAYGQYAQQQQQESQFERSLTQQKQLSPYGRQSSFGGTGGGGPYGGFYTTPPGALRGWV